jgi:predicted transcriptional regulator of viral defense system
MRGIESLPDDMLASGESIQTTAEITARLHRRPDIVYPALSRLVARQRLFSPAKGLYVAIPVEYRSWGVVPADQFIDRMMNHLHRRYYVGLLSAAEMHGIAHQAPQMFQVMVDRQLRPKTVERVRLRFHVNHHTAEDRGVEVRTVRTGTVRLAGPELLVLDLVQYPRSSGGLNNVATVFRELSGLDNDLLLDLAATRPRAVVRRLGWLLEHFAPIGFDRRLLEAADPAAGVLEPLAVDAPKGGGKIDPKWGLVINDEVEPDL